MSYPKQIEHDLEILSGKVAELQRVVGTAPITVFVEDDFLSGRIKYDDCSSKPVPLVEVVRKLIEHCGLTLGYIPPQREGFVIMPKKEVDQCPKS